jgi:hypothetical protein
LSRKALSLNVAWSSRTIPAHVSLLLPDVITPVWSLVSPRAETAMGPLPHSATASPSRSVPAVSVSHGPGDACSGPSQRGLPSGALGRTSPGHPGPGGRAVGPLTVGGRAGVGALLGCPAPPQTWSSSSRPAGGVAFLSHPVHGVSVVATWTRRVLPMRRPRRRAHHPTSPRASLRSGFFRHRLWSMSGAFPKPHLGSLPGGS